LYANGVYGNAMISVAETAAYKRKIASLLTVDEQENLIFYLAEHPNAGLLIQGTGGLRKLRWAQARRGKSRSIRVIYYFHSERMPLYLLAAFGKNEQANLSQRERNLLAKSVNELVASWKRNHAKNLH
jgi:hypothetical protein